MKYSLVALALFVFVTAQTHAEQARSASDFLDSISVCSHWSYPDTPYGFAYDRVKNLIVDCGIRHVRDGISNRIEDLGKAGIKTTLVVEPDLGSIEQIVAKIKSLNSNGAIDAVEGPNEPDLFWKNNKKTYKDMGFPEGVIQFQKDLYTALKADPATAKLKVIGPSSGVSYGYDNKSALGKGTLTDFVDWGCFHPYPGGNPFSMHFEYAGIKWYIGHGNYPSCNLDEFKYAFDVYSPPFGEKPMAATETGYSTWREGSSEESHAKYLPRLYCEYFMRGIARTSTYEFVDEFEDPGFGNREAHFGMIRRNLTPKPAYVAMKNLIAALHEDPAEADFKPQSLNYALAVKGPPGYDRTQYVHKMLLQKRTGEFELLIWHEIAGEDNSAKPPRQLSHPPMDVKITFETDVKSAAVIEPNVGASATPLTLTNRRELRLPVYDRVAIIQIQLDR